MLAVQEEYLQPGGHREVGDQTEERAGYGAVEEKQALEDQSEEQLWEGVTAEQQDRLAVQWVAKEDESEARRLAIQQTVQ